MKFKLEVDIWDLLAGVAILMIVIGLVVWNWPSLLVLIGAVYLVVYYKRESILATRKPDEESSS